MVIAKVTLAKVVAKVGYLIFTDYSLLIPVV